jgi:hypothetical protein
MRMIKSLAIAAMLVAVAAASPSMPEAAAASQKAMAASRDATAAVATALGAMQSVPRHMKKLKSTAHSLHRAFTAKQSSTPSATCDQAAFADATARVLQACPSLSGLVSGATSLEEFLPGFCGSECFTALSEELVRHVACVDGTTAFLLDFVYTCQTRPQCFSEGFVVGGSRIAARCDAQVGALLDITNFTAAARADAAAACSGTCVTDQSALLSQYAACLDGVDGASVTAAMRYMCSRPSGAAATAEICGLQLKAFGELQCDSAASCRASAKCDSTCSPILTTANLDAACGGCLEGFTPFLASFGDDAASAALGIQLFCSKVTPGAAASTSNPYCFPIAMATLASTGSSTSAATVCAAANAGVCTERVVGLVADAGIGSARTSFQACLGRTSSVNSCLPSYEAAIRGSVLIGRTGALLCSQNAASAYCYDLALQWAGASATCNGCTCSVDTSALLTTTGCCTPFISDFLQVTFDYPASYLPSGQQRIRSSTGSSYSFTHTARYSRPQLTRADVPFGGVVGCIGNTSAQWAVVESACPSTLASPPEASYPVTLAWDVVSATPALKAELEDSLKADTARNLGVSPRKIVNGTLVRGNGEVRLRTSASASGRQTTTNGANCRFTFRMDAATTAEATAAIAALSAKQSNGTFVTPSTGSTVAARCTECLDARQSSLVNAAAPAPGAAPSPGAGGVSPASGVAAATAAFAAAVVAVLAL